MTGAYLRYPHLRGELITFVAEDDIWLAPVSGGRAWRVSADQVVVRSPRLSPDGILVAWTSRRDAAPEVYVADVDGGPSRRLTFWGDDTTKVLGWTPDGDVLAASAVGQASTRRAWAYAVPVDGSPPRRLPYGRVGDVAYGPGGAVLLLSPTVGEPAARKRYRGGTTGKLWLDIDGSGQFTRILSEIDGDVCSPMWVGDRIAFLSDHEGVGDLYSCLPDGSDLRRHGPPADGQDFYARNAGTDGSRVIYHRAGELWLLDDLNAEPRRLDIRLGGSRVARLAHPLRPEHELGDVEPDHTGRASVVEVRGTVHWLTHRDGPVRALSDTPGVRARLPVVLGGDQVVWVTDADGEDALEIAPVDGLAGGVSPRRIGAGQLGRVLELAGSPDGRRIAVVSHDRRLLLVDSETGQLHEVARAEQQDPCDLAFSPDSAWLTWSHPGPEPLRHIRMVNTTDMSTVDVTPVRFVDHSPVFTVDGKHLVFLSARSFDPVYDEHVFDVSFPNAARPYLVPLAATTPAPFSPHLRGRPFEPDEDEKDDARSKKDDGDEAPRTVVDLDGLAERMVPVPVPPARYATLRAVKGGLVWSREPLADDVLDDPSRAGQRPALERYDFAKRKLETLLEGVDGVWASGDGQRLVVRDRQRLRVLPADRKVDGDETGDDNVTVDLSRIRGRVEPAAEWRQAFDEAGRLMRDHFWRADMGGVDWPGTLARYRPLTEVLGSHDDLVDLLWEVQGELNTSHAYVHPPEDSGDAASRLGLLGADLERDDGRWRVAKVLPGESSDPQARSPLRAPGVAVRVGDAILAVDGRPVEPEAGPAPLLMGTAGKPVELTIGPAAGGEHRRVVVEPLGDERALRYHDWVADRRAYVHEASDGRIGYLHVPDMIGHGWAQLHRDLRTEVRREALIVDVRENRGGHLSQLVVEKLGRKVIGWQVARDGYMTETYPLDAPRGPVVAVADEFAGSDGDIVNAAIKAMGIGPVVGTRTWGGVVGVDMRYHLVDGTLVTQPRYATWMAGPGWDIENHGVDPDIEVVVTPQDQVAGRDPQLDEAIRIALQRLAEHPAATKPELPS